MIEMTNLYLGVLYESQTSNIQTGSDYSHFKITSTSQRNENRFISIQPRLKRSDSNE